MTLLLFAHCQVDAMCKNGFLYLHTAVHVTFDVFTGFHIVASIQSFK